MPTYAEMAALYPEMETVIGVCIKKKKRIDEEAWIQHGVSTNCWYITHTEVVAGVSECEISSEDIVDYAEKVSLAACNALAQSYYHDETNGVLYINTINSDDPGSGNYYLVSLVEERVATDEMAIGGKPYQGLLQSSNIPDISSSIGNIKRGSVIQTFGEIVINNDGHYDTDLINYIYEICAIDVYMVGEARGVTSDVLTLWTGWTGQIEWEDLQIKIAIEDLRIAIP